MEKYVLNWVHELSPKISSIWFCLLSVWAMIAVKTASLQRMRGKQRRNRKSPQNSAKFQFRRTLGTLSMRFRCIDLVSFDCDRKFSVKQLGSKETAIEVDELPLLLYQLQANGVCVLLVFRFARNRIRDCIERAASSVNRWQLNTLKDCYFFF